MTIKISTPSILNARKYLQTAAMACFSFFVVASADATIVQFQTNLGVIEVNLYDNETPETVANFLSYVESGVYSQSVIHRLAFNFIVQGGGFSLAEEKIVGIPKVQSPINEPKFSNLKGTIAMAKIGGEPNSASSQWFFNLNDNSANLDVQNGGFTVFGEVISGMDVVEAMGVLTKYNMASQDVDVSSVFEDSSIIGVFSATPLISNPTVELFIAKPSDYFVIIDAIIVTDPEVDTAADLSPAANTLINEPVVVLPEPEPTPAPKKKKKSGVVDLSLLMIFLLMVTGLRFRKSRKHAI